MKNMKKKKKTSWAKRFLTLLILSGIGVAGVDLYQHGFFAEAMEKIAPVFGKDLSEKQGLDPAAGLNSDSKAVKSTAPETVLKNNTEPSIRSGEQALTAAILPSVTQKAEIKEKPAAPQKTPASQTDLSESKSSKISPKSETPVKQTDVNSNLTNSSNKTAQSEMGSNLVSKENPAKNAASTLFEDLVDAYIYAYPFVLMNTMENDMTRSMFFAPKNKMAYFTVLPSPHVKVAECPNVDSLMSTAWLDLTAEPQAVCMPESSDHSYIMELIDTWTNVVDSFGNNQISDFPSGVFEGRKIKYFLTAGPSSIGKCPKGVKVIVSPTNNLWLINRVLFGAPRSENDPGLAATARTLYEFEIVPWKLLEKELNKSKNENTKDKNTASGSSRIKTMKSAIENKKRQSLSPVQEGTGAKTNTSILPADTLKLKDPLKIKPESKSLKTEKLLPLVFPSAGQLPARYENSQIFLTGLFTRNRAVQEIAAEPVSPAIQTLENTDGSLKIIQIKNSEAGTAEKEISKNVQNKQDFRSSNKSDEDKDDVKENSKNTDENDDKQEVNSDKDTDEDDDQTGELNDKDTDEDDDQTDELNDKDTDEDDDQSDELDDKDTDEDDQTGELNNKNNTKTDDRTVPDDANGSKVSKAIIDENETDKDIPEETEEEKKEDEKIDQELNELIEENLKKDNPPFEQEQIDIDETIETDTGTPLTFIQYRRYRNRDYSIPYSQQIPANQQVPTVILETVQAENSPVPVKPDTELKKIENKGEKFLDEFRTDTDKELDKTKKIADSVKTEIKKGAQQSGRELDKAVQEIEKGAKGTERLTGKAWLETKKAADEGLEMGRNAVEYMDRRFHREAARFANHLGFWYDWSSRAVMPADKVEQMNANEFFSNFAKYYSANPVPAQDKKMEDLLKKLGLIYSVGQNKISPDANVRSLLRFAAPYAQGKINQKAIYNYCQSKKVNNWYIPENFGRYGTDYLRRAIVANEFIGANVPEQILYPFTLLDEKGEFLSGSKHYVLHFPAGQTPPADLLWSITIYDKQRNLTPNRLDRYAIRSNMPLVYNQDGSLDLLISHKEPKENLSNWLPAPKDEFMLMMRIYQPKKDVLDGKWQIPGVKHVSLFDKNSKD